MDNKDNNSSIVMTTRMGGKRPKSSIVIDDSKANSDEPSRKKESDNFENSNFTTKRVSFGIMDESLYKNLQEDYKKTCRRYGIDMSFSAFIQHKLKMCYEKNED